jgi:hypothetical protein
MTTQNVDVTAIRMHLNELKTQFNKSMLGGEEFASVKIYMQIKELECYLNELEWEADKKRSPIYYNHSHWINFFI